MYSKSTRVGESKGPTSNFRQQIRRLSCSLFCASFPRVDHRHPRRHERRGVARGDHEFARCGDGRDLRIANGQRVSRPARAAHQVRIGFCGIFVECQYAPRKNIAQQLIQGLIRAIKGANVEFPAADQETFIFTFLRQLPKG